MNRTRLFIFTAVAAVFFAACGVPDGNTLVSNLNANAANPTAAAPAAGALLALERQANEAYFKGDAKFFEGLLSDKFVMLGPGGSRMDKAAATKMIEGLKCDIKYGWKLDEPNVSTVDADTYVLTYKGTFDGTCTLDGKTEKAPSPVRAATVWIRTGDKWLAAFHGENLIVDPKAPAASPAKPEANKEEPKKDDKAAANSNSASNTAAPAKATADANTDALAKVELAVWEAWKELDAKKLEELTANDLAFVDIFGTVTSTKADTIKLWTEHRCEVNSVSVTDGVGTSLSPAVSILTFKGTADGTCYGQKIGGPIYGTSVYVKSGDAWKAAFTLNSPD
ncbi:MAG: nuclear transport factor 2 family protein [Blastocatellia bacterium]